jgi:hypothetical protein
MDELHDYDKNMNLWLHSYLHNQIRHIAYMSFVIILA